MIIFISFLFLAFSVPTVAFNEGRTYECISPIRVLAGDALDCRIKIDAYFKLYKDIRIRVARVDCPKVRGKEKEEGLIVKNVTKNLVINADSMKIANLQKGKFGRIIAEVKLDDVNLSDYLLSNDYCKSY